MQQCPNCRSENVHRSRPRTRWESWRREITGKRPYRCHECSWRGWGYDVGPKFSALEQEVANRALMPDPPNLKGTPLLRDDQAAQPIDLDQLDAPRFPRLRGTSLGGEDE